MKFKITYRWPTSLVDCFWRTEANDAVEARNKFAAEMGSHPTIVTVQQLPDIPPGALWVVGRKGVSLFGAQDVWPIINPAGEIVARVAGAREDAEALVAELNKRRTS